MIGTQDLRMKGNGCLKRHGKWRCLYPSPAVMNVAVWGEGRVKRGYSHLAYRWGDWVSQGRGGTARPDSSRSPSPTWLLMVPACERDVRVRGPHRESSIMCVLNWDRIFLVSPLSPGLGFICSLTKQKRIPPWAWSQGCREHAWSGVRVRGARRLCPSFITS